MSILVEGKESFTLTVPAIIVQDDYDTASEWAGQYISYNPAYKWVLGRYVEADRANRNSQYWTLDDLEKAKHSIKHAPLNMNHQANNVVGTFVGAEVLYPTKDVATDLNAHIEALAVFWKLRRPDEYKAVEAAFDSGSLAFSMENIAESVTCIGDQGCGETFDYAGFESPTYCSHLNDRSGIKRFNNSHFVGGALVTPPFRPGWANAHVEDIASDMVEQVEDQVQNTFPELDKEQWNALMSAVLQQPKPDFDRASRVGREFAERFIRNSRC